MRFMVLLASLMMAVTAWQTEALAGDPVAGRAYARHKCAECHDVGDPEQDSSVKHGPPFTVIARRTETTKDRLRLFLTSPHAGMPDFSISEQDMDDVIAFILGMRD